MPSWARAPDSGTSSPLNEIARVAAATASVHAALIACGFDKRTARASVDRALTHVGRDAPVEELLRAAFPATKHVAR